MQVMVWRVSWATGYGRVEIRMRGPAHRREARAYFREQLRGLGKKCPSGLRFQPQEARS
jgi:hypothetical protein